MDINYFAVIVAAVAAMVIGSAWYSSMLFGKQWMALRGKDPGDMKGMKFPAKEMLIQLVAALITAYVLAHFAVIANVTDFGTALQLGFWVWLGFQATLLIHAVLWEGRPWKLFVINAAQQLLSLLVMSVIVGLWH